MKKLIENLCQLSIQVALSTLIVAACLWLIAGLLRSAGLAE